MNVLDRTQPPVAQAISSVSIVPLHTRLLSNGLPLHTLQAGQQPVGRVELVFEGGSRAETVPNTAFFGSRLLSEGTRRHTAAEIAEFFDCHGAFLEISPGADRTTIALYALSRHFPVLLPMLREMITEAVFPEEELELQRNIALQHLRVSQEKTATVAGWLLREKLFGPEHPYGRHQTEANLQAFTRGQVMAFYENNFLQKPFQLFVSGNVPEADFALMDEVFGSLPLLPPVGPASSTEWCQSRL